MLNQFYLKQTCLISIGNGHLSTLNTKQNGESISSDVQRANYAAIERLVDRHLR